MNLQELNSPLPKPWLNIKANSVQTKTLIADTEIISNLQANQITLVNQASVPNPAVGSVALFTDVLNGKLNATNSLGDTVQYVTEDELIQDNVTLNLVENQVEPVAPAGQRDLWHLSATNGYFAPNYSPHFDLVWASGNITGGAYSNNGGASFTSCVFDVAPTDSVIFGSNESNLVVAFCFTGGQFYTSPDGINFTLRGTAATIQPEADKIMFFNNLFILSDNNTPNMAIATSPDGITWTSRAALVIAEDFNVSDSMIVGVGYTSPFMLYSLDGITWTNSPAVLEISLAVGYSPDKKQWGILSRLTGNLYSSSDGINYVLASTNNPTFCFSMIWVSKYSRWYVGAGDSNLNMSLWSTPDLSLTFVGAHLDGSHRDATGQDMPIVYMPSRDSFAIGSYSGNPVLEYSSVRPYDLKAVSDNIRVRGSPVLVSGYSLYGLINVNNTTTETSILNSVNSTGSLVLQAGQPLGMYIKIVIFLGVTSAAGDTLTIRIKTQAGVLLSIPITIPISAGLGIILKAYLTVQAATIECASETLLSAGSNTILFANPAYNPAIENTLDVSAQWGANVNQLATNGSFIEYGFRNGA